MRRRHVIASAAAVGLAVASGAVLLDRERPKRKSAKHGEESPPPQFHDSSIRLSHLPRDAGWDVCIVGSGPAGIVTSLELAKSGLRTLVIEGGVPFDQAARDSRYASLNGFINSGSIDYPLTGARVMTIGGTSAIWTGRCPRFLPIDFENNAYTPEGAAWPLAYTDLEPYYCQAEHTLRVHGEKEESYAPRSQPLPYPVAGRNENMNRLLERVGFQAHESATSISVAGQGPVRVVTDFLPQCARTPQITLLAGAMVRRFESDSSGRVTHVTVQDLTGVTRAIEARAFVLAAGGVESARRLMLSTSAQHPQGLGNDTGLLGRTFSDHPVINFEGTVEMPRGVEPGTKRCFQFYESSKRAGYGSIILVISAGPREGGRLRLSRNVPRRLRLGAIVEIYPSASNRVSLASGKIDPYGDPLPRLEFSYSDRDRRTLSWARALIRNFYDRLGARNVAETAGHWSHHHLGTVRMGRDATSGVVDANLCVHGTSNLFVLSSGTFVTGGASNPTLLITALAHRLGSHLGKQLANSALEPQPSRVAFAI
jgi:choline dehydrogenase-like flavoprotein